MSDREEKGASIYFNFSFFEVQRLNITVGKFFVAWSSGSLKACSQLRGSWGFRVSVRVTAATVPTAFTRRPAVLLRPPVSSGPRCPLNDAKGGRIPRG